MVEKDIAGAGMASAEVGIGVSELEKKAEARRGEARGKSFGVGVSTTDERFAQAVEVNKAVIWNFSAILFRQIFVYAIFHPEFIFVHRTKSDADE
jgi:hypothetical protein